MYPYWFQSLFGICLVILMRKGTFFLTALHQKNTTEQVDLDIQNNNKSNKTNMINGPNNSYCNCTFIWQKIIFMLPKE